MNADSIARALRGSFYRKNRLAFAAAALASLLNAVLNLILSWLMQPPVRRGHCPLWCWSGPAVGSFF